MGCVLSQSIAKIINHQCLTEMIKMVDRNRGRFVGQGGLGLGPQGECVCIQCGATVPHETGKPCVSMKCPTCEGIMRRKVLK